MSPEKFLRKYGEISEKVKQKSLEKVLRKSSKRSGDLNILNEPNLPILTFLISAYYQTMIQI